MKHVLQIFCVLAAASLIASSRTVNAFVRVVGQQHQQKQQQQLISQPSPTGTSSKLVVLAAKKGFGKSNKRTSGNGGNNNLVAPEVGIGGGHCRPERRPVPSAQLDPAIVNLAFRF